MCCYVCTLPQEEKSDRGKNNSLTRGSDSLQLGIHQRLQDSLPCLVDGIVQLGVHHPKRACVLPEAMDDRRLAGQLQGVGPIQRGGHQPREEGLALLGVEIMLQLREYLRGWQAERHQGDSDDNAIGGRGRRQLCIRRARGWSPGQFGEGREVRAVSGKDELVRWDQHDLVGGCWSGCRWSGLVGAVDGEHVRREHRGRALHVDLQLLWQRAHGALGSIGLPNTSKGSEHAIIGGGRVTCQSACH